MRHPDTATSLNNLALLLEVQRDYAAARPLYEQALAIRKEVLGAWRDPDTAQSLNNLAMLLWAQGYYAAARPLYEQALPSTRRSMVMPPRHRRQPEQPGGAAQVAGGLRRRQAPPRYPLAIREAVLGATPTPPKA